MNLVLAFLANFFFIFLKAFQQLNVVHSKYWWVIPTSMLMSLGEIYIIAYVALTGFQPIAVLVIGLGAGLGCVCSMLLHRRMFNVQHKN